MNYNSNTLYYITKQVLVTFFDFHLFCFQENKGDREILNSVEVELHRMKENLSNKINQTTGNDITTELRRKDRELVAKVYYYKYH
jgi:hypothetical protein